jgi:hypothetical protein
MGKHALCRNKLTKRQERLIRKAHLLRAQFENFKTELDLELMDMQNMMTEINKNISDISMVMDKPKKERQDKLRLLQSNNIMLEQ